MKIDRNDILNSEMYTLYCRLENEKHRKRFKTDEEYIEEERKEKEYAQKWLDGTYSLDADEEYRRSGLKRAYNEVQLKESCMDPADEDLCKDAEWIEREVSSYCIVSSRIYHIVKELLQIKDYTRFWQLLSELKYVPLQCGVLLQIKSHEDFMNMAKSIDKTLLSHPITIATMLRNRWFEWVVSVSYNLTTYKTDRRIYKYSRYEDLLKEGGEVRKIWNSELNDVLQEGFETYCNILSCEDMLEWVYGINKSGPFLMNEYSAIHDDIVDRLRNIAIGSVSVHEIVNKTEKLQLLTAIAEKGFETDDFSKADAKKLWISILTVLGKNNFVKPGEIHADDEHCMKTIGHLWIVIFDDLEKDILDLLRSRRSHFEGWCVNHSEMYESVKLESFLMSVAVKVAFMTDMGEEEKYSYWKSICTYIVDRMHNCDNGYISSEYFSIPLVFADHHAGQTSYSGLSFLRNLVLNRVHGIDTVLKILYMSSAEADESIKSLLAERIDLEWPSCRELMKLRRQNSLIEQYETVIKRMTKY